MFVTQTRAAFVAAATAAGLTLNTDYAVTEVQLNGPSLRVLALTMKGLRFLAWDTAANGQPGLGLQVPDGDLLLLLLNIQATAAGKGAAWPQT